MNPASRSPICPENDRTGARILEAHDLAVLRLREGQAILDALHHGRIDQAGFPEIALLLRALARSEVAQTRLATHDFARRRDLEPLGGRFLRLATCNRFWHGSAEGSGSAAAGKLFFRVPDD